MQQVCQRTWFLPPNLISLTNPYQHGIHLCSRLSAWYSLYFTLYSPLSPTLFLYNTLNRDISIKYKLNTRLPYFTSTIICIFEHNIFFAILFYTSSLPGLQIYTEKIQFRGWKWARLGKAWPIYQTWVFLERPDLAL